MGKDLLFEIGVEEVPHNYLSDVHYQMESIFRDFFSKNELRYSELKVFSTPRRLAVLVLDLPEKQNDKKIVKKGPAKSVAYTSDGKPTKALEGFLNSVSNLQGQLKTIKEGEKEFILFEGVQKGEETEILIKRNIPELVLKLKFPKVMRWSDINYQFVRPIRWVALVFGNEIIELEIANIKSSNISQGHRLIGKNVEIKDPRDYERLLEEEGKVIPSPEKRKSIILNEIHKVENEFGCSAILPDHLLMDIVNLVEFPRCAIGTFDENFLDVPNEVLISEMIDHQKFIPLKKDNKLINMFIIITNTYPNEKIVKGNEKVISARLSDGKFLYEEDLKKSLSFFIEKTKGLIFFGGLGTIYDKMERMEELSKNVLDILNIKDNKDDIIRSASICKFDLTTGVVYEFPELQGVIGYYYSKFFGESENVASFIKEHYKPVSFEDELPSTLGAGIVSIVDKLDNLFALYSAGKKVSGSSDPYSLRRQVIGVARICINYSLNLDISELFEMSKDLYRDFMSSHYREVKEEITQFVSNRLKSFLKEIGFRTDEVEATIKKTTNPYDAYTRVKSLNEFRNKGEFVKVGVLFKRVRNILNDAGFLISKGVNPILLTDDEKVLYELVETKKVYIADLLKNRNYTKLLEELLEFQEPINNFFEKVFVMDENKKIRENRLSLLYELYRLFDDFIDFNSMELA